MNRSGALRYFASIKNGSTPASGEPAYWDGDVAWATPDDLGHLQGSYIAETKRMVTSLAVAENNLNLVPADSVLISTRAPIGHMAITARPLTFNQGCRALIPHAETWGPYLLFLLKSRVPELNSCANGTTFVELSRDDLAAVRIELPPLETQKRVAAFLGEKTAQINALIAHKEALLERLAEKRQAIITHAITRGLALAAPLKDSGIEWLGQIPAHWQVVPLRRMASRVVTGRTPAAAEGDFFTDGIVPWFTPGDFNGGIVLGESDKCLVAEAFSGGHAVRYPAGSVLLVGIGATLGKVAVAPTECSSNQQINAITPLPENDPVFLAYFLHSFRNEVRVSASGNTLPILNQDKTKSISIARPTPAEQSKIAKYLMEVDRRIGFVTSRVKTSIHLLNEERATLITRAVTGQIEGLQ